MGKLLELVLRGCGQQRGSGGTCEMRLGTTDLGSEMFAFHIDAGGVAENLSQGTRRTTSAVYMGVQLHQATCWSLSLLPALLGSRRLYVHPEFLALSELGHLV